MLSNKVSKQRQNKKKGKKLIKQNPKVNPHKRNYIYIYIYICWVGYIKMKMLGWVQIDQGWFKLKLPC